MSATQTRDRAADAARKAAALLDAARPAADDHPYLVRRQIPAPAAVREIALADAVRIIGYTPKGGKAQTPLVGPTVLVVPVHVDGELSTVEMIDGEKRKSFLAYGRTSGGYWTTVPLPDCDWHGDLHLLVGEGVATVVSASTATGCIGVAAMSCGNLVAVGREMRTRYPDARLTFLADLGIGETKCAEGARAAGGDVATPQFPDGTDGKDFNDLHRRCGLRAVAECIASAVKPEPAAVGAEVVSGGDYRFSESEAARRFGDILRGRAVFAADEGQWYHYDGARWMRDHGGVWLLGESLVVSRAYAEDAIRAGSSDVHFQARMATAKTYNALPGRKRLIELAKAEAGLAIPSSRFDADPWMFNVKNGTINLRTGELRPHNSADLATKIAPVRHDPTATRERWDRFIVEVIPDAEARAHFQRVVGYCLTGDVSEHKLFFCYGTGANGKSVVLEVLLALLGDHGTLAPVSLLMAKPTEQHPCDRMVLRGRRLAVFAETPAGQRWDESTVKALTGGDTITARGMRENFSTFPPTAKFAIAGNHRPRVNDLSEGFWRRFEEIPFEVTIPEDRRDSKLADRLRAELSGILLWALEGCAAWQREGLGKSVKVQTATRAYRAESDRLGPFLAERCLVSPDARVSNADLRTAYHEWCEREGERPLAPRDFAEQLGQQGISRKNVAAGGRSVRGWAGVSLVQGHMDVHGREFPVSRLEDSSREVNRETASIPVHLSMTGADRDPEGDL